MNKRFFIFIAAALMWCSCATGSQDCIPLAEHPRPDFERCEWLNLNGEWDFTFDESAASAAISGEKVSFDRKIMVPFPWGSNLSGVEDGGDIAWYARDIKIPSSWKGKRVFLVVGASDWETSAWLDGKELGTHKGGYVPFEFEVTAAGDGKSHRLVVKADDTSDDSHLYGKQGYGNARGIWQTVYLEARGGNFIKSLHFTPDIDASTVKVDVALVSAAADGEAFRLSFKNGECPVFEGAFDGDKGSFVLPIENQHLWDIDDPYLYEVKAEVLSGSEVEDCVNSYFGQRKIGVEKLPGADFNYVALNNKPLYLQLCLDQSYHPDGFYTFPSDEFMKKEIELSKSLGLNGNRIHIKVEIPRKLYWADKLGLLIMADTPNFWGEPRPEAREDWENCMRAQVERDYNHPSIFAWVNFNETWGLFTKTDDGKRQYLPETQEWVRSMYHLTKSIDPSRLVEDNSACNQDHVESDINSWHAYERGFYWEQTAAEFDSKTYPGSTFNYIGGNRQGDAPMINSECGNVWGYDHSSGDCDFTWDYHIMMDAFHRHPKIAGWLYTEHHDVINEWNGYVKFDRSAKIDGLCELVEGMKISDFHSPYYIECTDYLFTRTRGGKVSAPLYASFTTDKDPGTLSLETALCGWDALGEKHDFWTASMPVEFKPYFSGVISDGTIDIPEADGLYLYSMVLKNAEGKVLHRNFTTFRVDGVKGPEAANTTFVTFPVGSYSAKDWTVKDSLVMGGLKANGFGNGWFEYCVDLPEAGEIASASLLFEASSKQVFGKDIRGGEIDGDFMLGAGTFDHCKSPNSYAMTDEVLWPSRVAVSVDGKEIGSVELADDPADHRGILSWGSQVNERAMSESGSYGQLVKFDVPAEALAGKKSVTIRFAVPADVNSGMGGLALYGKDFGRYPLDPTLVIVRK